jgi:hypothetical protein
MLKKSPPGPEATEQSGNDFDAEPISQADTRPQVLSPALRHHLSDLERMADWFQRLDREIGIADTRAQFGGLHPEEIESLAYEVGASSFQSKQIKGDQNGGLSEQVILVGNLGTDPEVHQTKGSKPVVNFTLATSGELEGQGQRRA